MFLADISQGENLLEDYGYNLVIYFIIIILVLVKNPKYFFMCIRPVILYVLNVSKTAALSSTIKCF